jgi:hypothetical protein
MSVPATIRVNVPVPFPSLVTGSGPITVTKVNGIWTVGWSTASLATQVPPLANYPTDFVTFYDSIAKTFFNMSLSGLLATGQARVAADFPVTSSNVLVNVTGLSVNVAAGRVYAFEAKLLCTDAAAGGVQAAINGTATATAIIYEGYTQDANTIKGQVQATALGTAVGSTTTTGTTPSITIRGTINVSASGTLTVQFAQNTSNGTASTVKTGSTFSVRDIT